MASDMFTVLWMSYCMCMKLFFGFLFPSYISTHLVSFFLCLRWNWVSVCVCVCIFQRYFLHFICTFSSFLSTECLLFVVLALFGVSSSFSLSLSLSVDSVYFEMVLFSLFGLWIHSLLLELCGCLLKFNKYVKIVNWLQTCVIYRNRERESERMRAKERENARKGERDSEQTNKLWQIYMPILQQEY